KDEVALYPTAKRALTQQNQRPAQHLSHTSKPRASSLHRAQPRAIGSSVRPTGAVLIEREALHVCAQPPRCRGAGRGRRAKLARGANSARSVTGPHEAQSPRETAGRKKDHPRTWDALHAVGDRSK